MTFTKILVLLTAAVFTCCYLISSLDLEFSDLDLKDAGDSSVSPWYLLYCRALFFVVALILGLFIYFDQPISLTVYGMDGQPKKVNIQNYERFGTFTVWCWTLQILYFFLATLASIDFLFEKSYMSQTLLCVAWILYELSFSTAYLVTVVVTFVLIPGGKAKGIPVDIFFKRAPLCLHNLNVIFILTETFLNKLDFEWAHFPFIILFGCAYVLFSWVWLHTKGFVFYFFLDYTRKDALFLHIGLLSALSAFFTLGCYISSLKDSHDPVTAAVIIFASLFILKVKE